MVWTSHKHLCGCKSAESFLPICQRLCTSNYAVLFCVNKRNTWKYCIIWCELCCPVAHISNVCAFFCNLFPCSITFLVILSGWKLACAILRIVLHILKLSTRTMSWCSAKRTQEHKCQRARANIIIIIDYWYIYSLQGIQFPSVHLLHIIVVVFSLAICLERNVFGYNSWTWAQIFRLAFLPSWLCYSYYTHSCVAIGKAPLLRICWISSILKMTCGEQRQTRWDKEGEIELCTFWH